MTKDHELQQEREANEFALALLIPEHLIREDIDEIKKRTGAFSTDREIERLAKKYKVDIMPMIARLVKLKLINL